ncbi:DUF3422 family protein [Marinobacter sp.]|uniref:DUF3422 family protein n=1 Tax=Marinobacter sp. TaxID=50741 RepID=UPI00356AE8C8
MTHSLSIPEARVHPERESLYQELHARPFPIIEHTGHITHLALLLTESEREADYRHLVDLCQRYGVHPPDREATSFNQALGDIQLRWERHLEFVTYTFMRDRTSGAPFENSAWALLPQSWIAGFPGLLVAAFHLDLVDSGQADWSREALADAFEGHRLIQASLGQGAATLISAFRLHGDGFGRFLMHSEGLRPSQLGRLVQRLLELETYRLMALLSTKLAREMAPVLGAMDTQLADIITRLSQEAELNEEQALLTELTSMAARIEQERARTTSRFGATRAYYELVQSRLTELEEVQSGRNFTLHDFFHRRLTPSVNTCEAVALRLEDIARRIERASDLIRTRVDLKLEAQNRNLLASMNRRSRLQLRLQETVEGLSIAAISYYSVSLLGYLFAALESTWPAFSATWATAASIPVVVGSIWWITRRIKRLIINAEEPGTR